MKSKNHKICQYLMISYTKAMIKKLNVYHTFCHVHCLQTETSPKKFHKFKKKAVRFVGKVKYKLEFEFKILIFFVNNMCYAILKFDIF
jgi:hypothetical protein